MAPEEEYISFYKQFLKLNFVQEKSEFELRKKEFVYHSNRLEGSGLTLIQTIDVIEEHRLRGEASVEDTLMAIDHYRALNQALLFGGNKYPLSSSLLLQIHEVLLKNSFNVDPFYNSWKSKGQELGSFKVADNKIKIGDEYYDTPSFDIVVSSMELLLKIYSESIEILPIKLGKLIQNIYNLHPFFDGNKRMTRLIVAHQLLKNEIPLLVFHEYKNSYNQALINGFSQNSNEEITTLLTKMLNKELYLRISKTKTSKKGFNMIW